MNQPASEAVSPDGPMLVDAVQSAGLTEWFRFRELLRNLVLRDLRLKYRGSVLGFFWSLANPLVMVGVYSVAFGLILKIATPHYVLYLVTGLLPWGCFAGSLMASTGSVIDGGSLVKAVYFPRAILPIAVVLFNLTQFVMTFAVVLPAVLLVHGMPLTPPMLAFPLLLLLQTLFTVGLALLLATATAFYRDVRHLLDVALQVVFWLTPIIYELKLIPPVLRALAWLAPMTPFIMGYRQCLYYGIWPEPLVWVQATTYAGLAFLAGLRVFRAYEDRFTEQL
jgi:ABC-type polysaccharide/polyol phosphate export permease